jgi:hypothetical protein
MNHLLALVAGVIVILFFYYRFFNKSNYEPSPSATGYSRETISKNFTYQYQQILTEMKNIISEARITLKTRDETKTLLEPEIEKFKLLLSGLIDSYLDISV